MTIAWGGGSHEAGRASHLWPASLSSPTPVPSGSDGLVRLLPEPSVSPAGLRDNDHQSLVTDDGAVAKWNVLVRLQQTPEPQRLAQITLVMQATFPSAGIGFAAYVGAGASANLACSRHFRVAADDPIARTQIDFAQGRASTVISRWSTRTPIRSSLGLVVRMALTAVTLASIVGCAALNPQPVSTPDRLAAFPTGDLPLDAAVTVRWNDRQIPWIEATTDRDLAFTLGLIQAHLRLGQLAAAKRIAQGRTSEMIGPLGNDIDQVLRTIDFGYAAPAIEARMPQDTLNFVRSFVNGLNWYQAHARRRPPEYGLLGISDEPWTVRDVLTIGRLAGTDVNWLVMTRLLRERDTSGWDETWHRALEDGGTWAQQAEADSKGGRLAFLEALLAGMSRSGSDAVAVSPARSATGGALLASDPHLGLSIPPYWIIVGMRSPSFHVVGLMPPGLPIVGLGRNDDIAWAGTNMHAASSDLYDLGGTTEAASATSRRERIRTRFWFDEEATVRRVPLGPIVSDAALIPHRPGEQIVLRWTGYEPSDEITAFLGVMRAHAAEDFRRALAGYGVAGQTMICATRTGDICRVMAVHLPLRNGPPRDLVHAAGDPTGEWHGFLTAMDLPFTLNPAEGLLASANDRPKIATPTPVGFFFAPDGRVQRLYDLLRAKPVLSLRDLSAMQGDVCDPQAIELRDRLLTLIDQVGAGVAAPMLIKTLRSWDGCYGEHEAGPVAFETLLFHLAHMVYAPDQGGDPPASAVQWGALVHHLPDDLAADISRNRPERLAAALRQAESDSRGFPTWGDMHRVRVGWLAASAPYVGRLFTIADLPTGGSRNTIMKSAHGVVRDRHSAEYGSEARELIDMSSPDENSFVMFGGEDGWLGSANFADQISMWRSRAYVSMPLTAEKVAVAFPRTMQLFPLEKPRPNTGVSSP